MAIRCKYFGTFNVLRDKILSMKQLTFLTAFLLTTGILSAQEAPYKQALGIKFPGGFSFTYKNFVRPTQNIELQANIWQKGFRTSALYEFNYPITDLDGLRLFFGPGAHVGFWAARYKEQYNNSADIGVDGIIGVDYKFADFPINISVDWQPSIVLIGNSTFTPNIGGLAIRYTF